MIPCNDCLILPICKTKTKEKIDCQLLYRWWFRVNGIHNYLEDMEEAQKYLDVSAVTFITERSKYR